MGKPQPGAIDTATPHNGALSETTWEEAMDEIVRRSRELITQYKAGTIGFYNCFLKKYYTLAIIGDAGVKHTPAVLAGLYVCCSEPRILQRARLPLGGAGSHPNRP
jgi:hypothetical protein